MFTMRVDMSQANETEPVESTTQAPPRREATAAAAADTRAARVFLRIPDCTARLSTSPREGFNWRAKLQTITEMTGPWLDIVRPMAPPRVLAASAIGILLGLVMILLTPGKKPAPVIQTHTKQVATEPRSFAPPPVEKPEGPRVNVGTTDGGSAANMAALPNLPARIDEAPAPRFQNVLRPDNTPTAERKSHAILDGTIQQ